MVFAKRSLSQNFLIDHNIRRKLVEELGSEPGDAVLEIGPGHGELSDLLAGRVSRLVLVEKDDRLATDLARRYVDRLDIQVVHGDALQADLSALLGDDRPGRLICNVPYGITSPLIFRFLEIRPFPHRMVLLVQREVAEIRARVRVAFAVGRRAFRPVPRVDSCAVVIERAEVPPAAADLEKLRIMTRVCFSRRRKQIGTILRTAPEFRLPRERLPEILGQEGIDPKARPETLSPAQFLALARRLERF